MTLTPEQQQELTKLSEYFRKIEKLTVDNTIDLDVFMTDYRDDGFAVYATEKIKQEENSSLRKQIFEKEGKENKQAKKPVK